MIRIELEMEIKDASHIAKALNVDNEGYPIETLSFDNRIICTLSGDECGTLKNITDDILACLTALEG